MGLVKRRWYKPERRPARKKGVFEKQAPIGLPNASKPEIAMALFTLCEQAGVVVGQGGTYDGLKDLYTVIGKSRFTGKAQDFEVQGAEVASVIRLARMLNGGAPMREAPVSKRGDRQRRAR